MPRRKRTTPPLAERLWAKVDKAGPGGCWLWTGATKKEGYGQIGDGPRGAQKHLYAHRVAWELVHGPIPEGLHIDHLCRVRNCVNPDHLEPVTPRENTMRGDSVSAANARKTHCVHDHAFTPENTDMVDGRRRCRTCYLARNAPQYIGGAG